MFLIRLRDNLPSQSLHDKRWPEAPERFKNTSMELKKIHHRWRVRTCVIQLNVINTCVVL